MKENKRKGNSSSDNVSSKGQVAYGSTPTRETLHPTQVVGMSGPVVVEFVSSSPPDAWPFPTGERPE